MVETFISSFIQDFGYNAKYAETFTPLFQRVKSFCIDKNISINDIRFGEPKLIERHGNQMRFSFKIEYKSPHGAWHETAQPYKMLGSNTRHEFPIQSLQYVEPNKSLMDVLNYFKGTLSYYQERYKIPDSELMLMRPRWTQDGYFVIDIETTTNIQMNDDKRWK